MACRYRRDGDGDPSPASSEPARREDERVESTMSVSISHVAFEHHTNTTALGIGEASPRISWRFEGNAANWTQGGYTLQVHRASESKPELFNFNSSESLLVDWPTVALSSAEAATVRVKAYGAGDLPNTPWSDDFTVETGLLTEDAWNGALMIASNIVEAQNLAKQPIQFRKEFEVQSDVASARLYITSYGLYEAYINGQRVGDAVLAPGWQSYTHRLVYDTYDVTELVTRGSGAIGIVIGEGWYAGALGWDGAARNIYGATLGAMALLVITDRNGTQQSIPTDLTWQSGTGPLITAEIYNGTKYDSRLEEPGWANAGFKATTSWTGVQELNPPFDILRAPDGPPIRRLQEVQLQKVFTSPSGKTLLDFGQNMVGWLRLQISGPAGTNITLTHAEVLVDGELALSPLRNASQADHFVLSGDGTQTWEPSFTYHGFRYVQVENWPEDYTPLDSDSVVGIVVHSDMEETGFFECSNALLNKLHENIRWSMKGNFMSVPTDCPQRDERLGWAGDAHAFSPSANFLYDTAGFWRGWLRDVQSEQMQNNSIVPVTIPVIPKTSIRGATAVWGDVVVAAPWNAYTTFADLDMLQDEYIGAKAWIDKGIPRNQDGLWDRSTFQYGDWLPPDNETTNAYLVADAYLVYVTGLVAQMAEALGLSEASYYSNWRDELKQKFLAAWVSPSGIVANETQTGLTLPLWFDLFDTDDDAWAAAARLEKKIADNNYLVGTGFAGTHLLGLALTKYNLTDTFYNMILQESVPSWLYQVIMNGTTTWERWDSMLPDGQLNPLGATSFNHYSFGSVANWMHQTIGGLAPAEPGWKTIQVRPIPGGGITSAGASYITPYGTVSTNWKVTDAGFYLQLVVPPNTKANVTVPGRENAPLEVGSGTYEFLVQGFTL